MASDNQKIHLHFVGKAKGLSMKLADAIKQVGVLEFEPDNSEPLVNRICRSVAQQQLSVKAASTIWNRVLEAAKDETLSEFFIEENSGLLHTCGLSKAKVRAICGIAEGARRGNLHDLKSLDFDERTKHLTSFWGVGRWTADMISIFYFGDKDVWPDGDLAARKTLERLTSRRRKTVRMAERFVPYRSYLALYMWKYQDAVPD